MNTMREEIYITKTELQNNNNLVLKLHNHYTLIDKIEDDVIEKSESIQCSFIVTGFNKQRLFLSIEGSPKYHRGLFSLYSIYKSMEAVVDKETLYKIEHAVCSPEHHEMIIEVQEDLDGTTGRDLFRKIEKHQDRFTTLVKQHLLYEAVSNGTKF